MKSFNKMDEELIGHNCFTGKLEYITENLKGKVLDVGFSSGLIHKQIISMRKDCEIWGLDLKIVSDYYNGDKNVIIDDAQTMNKVPNESFDTVFAGEIIEHLEDENSFLENTNRILKKGGILILTTPNRNSLVNIIFHSYEHKGHKEDYGTNFHRKLFTIGELKRLLKEKEFEIVDEKMMPFLSGKQIWINKIRATIGLILPKYLREDIVLIAKKIDVININRHAAATSSAVKAKKQ
ncbi:class I SAM-dependent methyltransferase [archaeon]|nr:MAG: class I SAM-dependent methyltransferase [archaeon]